jgi:natural product biosynthesis luciferase-like monooxygenase protein
MKFSLSFFSNVDSSEPGRIAEQYEFLLRLVAYAENQHYHGVWIPERHFHPFGGLFPNPAVFASAVAMTTENLRIQVGSVVLPLHNPVFVAEEWAMVDQLSRGRVDMSFASGWNSKDFVFSPSNYENRKEIMWDGISYINKLWKNTLNKVKILPTPYQQNIPIFITSSKSTDTCYQAGLNGYNLLTHFISNDLEDLQGKIKVYQDGLREGGHSITDKEIVLMLHTYIGDTLDQVEDKSKNAFISYQNSFLELEGQKLEISDDRKSEITKSYIFKKYSPERSLMGTLETSRELLRQVKESGVTQIAALVDFGMNEQDVMIGLDKLTYLKKEMDELQFTEGSK